MARTRSVANLTVWPPTSTTTPAGVASLSAPWTQSPPFSSTTSGEAAWGQTRASAMIAATARRPNIMSPSSPPRPGGRAVTGDGDEPAGNRVRWAGTIITGPPAPGKEGAARVLGQAKTRIRYGANAATSGPGAGATYWKPRRSVGTWVWLVTRPSENHSMTSRATAGR